MFGRLIGAGGLGAYLGAAVAGLVAVVTGQALSAGSPWLAGVPVLAVLGAGVGAAIARVTRSWFLPGIRRRMEVFTAVGVVVLPLAAAFGQLRWSGSVGILLVLAGGIATMAIYLRTPRAAARRTGASRPRPGAR